MCDLYNAVRTQPSIGRGGVLGEAECWGEICSARELAARINSAAGSIAAACHLSGPNKSRL